MIGLGFLPENMEKSPFGRDEKCGLDAQDLGEFEDHGDRREGTTNPGVAGALRKGESLGEPGARATVEGVEKRLGPGVAAKVLGRVEAEEHGRMRQVVKLCDADKHAIPSSLGKATVAEGG